MISAVVKGQTLEGYSRTLEFVQELIQSAPGFIAQCAHPVAEGWQVFELWESKAMADQFFRTYIVPNLPQGVHPKRTYQELHNVLTTQRLVMS